MTDPPAAAPRLLRGMVAIAAVAAVALTACFYQYMTHIPEARAVTVPEPIGTVAGRELLLDGLRTGPVFSLNVRASGRVKLRFDSGATLVAPTAEVLATYPPAPGVVPEPGLRDRQWLEIATAPGDNAQIDFSIEGARPGLVIEPEPPDAGAHIFRLRARHGTLGVHAEHVPGPGSDHPGWMHLTDAHSARQVDRVTFRIPDGVWLVVSMQMPGEIANQGGADSPVVVELPTALESDPEVPRLDVGAVAVGMGNGDGFDVDRIDCAAQTGRSALWRSPFPAIRVDSCQPYGLQVSGFNPNAQPNQLNLIAGNAFRTGDYWHGPPIFQGNLVVSTVAGMLLTAILAWATAKLKSVWGTPVRSVAAAKGRRRGRRPKG